MAYLWGSNVLRTLLFHHTKEAGTICPLRELPVLSSSALLFPSSLGVRAQGEFALFVEQAPLKVPTCKKLLRPLESNALLQACHTVERNAPASLCPRCLLSACQGVVRLLAFRITLAEKDPFPPSHIIKEPAAS